MEKKELNAETAQPIPTIINNPGPVIEFPLDDQTIDFNETYTFKLQPMPNAEAYLWGFFQGGKMVWETMRDEGSLSGPQYQIPIGSAAHSKFTPGDLEVVVRGWVAGGYTDSSMITIHLVEGGLQP